MDENDHRLVMAELDALRLQVTNTIQKFEAASFAAILKDDYVALHELEHRIMNMRLGHARAIGKE